VKANVEKLTGSDLVKMTEAGIIRQHEARQAAGFSAVPDGWRCSQCGHVYEDPNKPPEQLTIEGPFQDGPAVADLSSVPVEVTGTGMVITDTDKMDPQDVKAAGEAFVASQGRRPVARPA